MLPLKTKESLYRSLILLSLLSKIDRASLKRRRVKGIIIAFTWTGPLITCSSCRVLILGSNSAISSSLNVWNASATFVLLCQNIATTSPGLLDCCPFFFRLPNLVKPSDASWLILRNRLWDFNQSKTEKYFEWMIIDLISYFYFSSGVIAAVIGSKSISRAKTLVESFK